MNENTKPVEGAEAAGAQNGVKETPATAPAQEVDFLDEFQKLIEDNKKLTGERDNYKKGLLAKKRGEVDVTVTEEDDLEAKAEIRAQEIIRQKELEANEAKARGIALQAMKENRELKIALKNKNGIATTASTSSQGDSTASKGTAFWSAEQLAYFKSRNIDPNKVQENYIKLKA